jgi:hypothetical protein
MQYIVHNTTLKALAWATGLGFAKSWGVRRYLDTGDESPQEICVNMQRNARVLKLLNQPTKPRMQQRCTDNSQRDPGSTNHNGA